MAFFVLAAFVAFIALGACNDDEVELQIRTEWDGTPFNHDPIIFKIKRKPADASHFLIEVTAPFFDDPPPNGPAGAPFPGLWDYEVAEIFFLGENKKYLEIELSPHGQHLLLILKGERNMVEDKLPIVYNSRIYRGNVTWCGTAEIPYEYLPPGVNKVNAYAIHGVANNRKYEALYPANPDDHAQPDFHRLNYFQNINISPMLPTNWQHRSIYDDK